MNEYCKRDCGREAVVIVDARDEQGQRLAVCATCFSPSDLVKEFRRPAHLGTVERAQPSPDPEATRHFCNGCGHFLAWGAAPGFCDICETAEAFLAGLARGETDYQEDSGFQVAKDLQRGDGRTI